MRQAKLAEELKQRQILADSLKAQKEKRATKVNQLISQSDAEQRPMTAGDSSYSTRVQTHQGVDMQYYDPNNEEELSRPKTAPSQSAKIHGDNDDFEAHDGLAEVEAVHQGDGYDEESAYSDDLGDDGFEDED